MQLTTEYSLPTRRRRFLRAARMLPRLPDLIGKPAEYQMAVHDIECQGRLFLDSLLELREQHDPDIQREILVAKAAVGYACTLSGVIQDQESGIHPYLEPWVSASDRTKLAFLDERVAKLQRRRSNLCPRHSTCEHAQRCPHASHDKTVFKRPEGCPLDREASSGAAASLRKGLAVACRVVTYPFRKLRYFAWHLPRSARRGKALLLRHEFIFEVAARAFTRMCDAAAQPE